MRFSKKAKNGFTLIELMIIIVILGILGLLGLNQFFGAMERAKVASVKSNMKALQTASEAYGVDWGGVYAPSYYELREEGKAKGFWKDFTNPFMGEVDKGMTIAWNKPPFDQEHGMQAGSMKSASSPLGVSGALSSEMVSGTVAYMGGGPANATKYAIYGLGRCEGSSFDKLVFVILHRGNVYYLSNG